jgi:hypothetical protein
MAIRYIAIKRTGRDKLKNGQIARLFEKLLKLKKWNMMTD